jgi:hypothetical protein
MSSEGQRLERLAERLRAVEPAPPSPAAKIRAWNLIVAEVEKPAARRRQARSSGRLVLAGLAAAALLVAGTIAAAADSLPDSTLYPVKGVIEAVQGGLALTPAAQFDYHLGLARTRLREAEAMFARHRVDLADAALTSMEGQLTSAATVVRTTRLSEPAIGESLAQQLAQAVETHDNQLAELQGQVTNPSALDAITQARNRAQDALVAASRGADQGQGKQGNPSGKAHGSPNGTPADSPKATSHRP